jgi:integrase
MPRTHAKGDGTTIQRGAQWWAIVPLPAAPDGTRRRWWQKASPNTETGAEQTRRRMLREVATQPRPVTRTRLGDWLASYVARRAGQVRPNTVLYEKQAIARLEPLHALWLDAVTPARVQAWVDGEVAAGYAPQTIKGRLVVLRAALSLAVDLELITRNPATKVRGPRVLHTEHPILTAEQARALLAAVEDTIWAPVIAVAAALALRQGEALGLRWADVDLAAGRLTVRRQLQMAHDGHGGKDLDAPLKTPGSRRTVPLPAPIVALLTRHRDRQRLATGRAPMLVCTNARGEALHPRSVNQAWCRYRDQIGAPAGMTYHDLRHSAASLLAAQGVSQPVVMALLGHTTPTMTSHYQHASQAGLDEAAAALGRALAADG